MFLGLIKLREDASHVQEVLGTHGFLKCGLGLEASDTYHDPKQDMGTSATAVPRLLLSHRSSNEVTMYTYTVCNPSIGIEKPPRHCNCHLKY